MGRQPTIQWGFDQKPGGEVPQIVVTTNHVGADVLICPSSTARQTLSTESTSGASLRWADEDICPYVVRGVLSSGMFLRLSRVVQRLQAQEPGGTTQFFLNPQQLVVLGDAI